MSLKKNILAIYGATGVIALAPILAMPWYLSALGPGQFGLISFVMMLQAVFGLLDAGMSQALVREFAERLHGNDTLRDDHGAARLLLGFERVYWLLGFSVAGIALLLSRVIATHWLKLGDVPFALGGLAVQGSAVLFAAQFPGSLYRSLLVGAQAHIPLSRVMLIFAVLRHGGGVAAIMLFPSLAVYLIWHAALALMETGVRAVLAWHTLGTTRRKLKLGAPVTIPRSVWKMVMGLSGSALLGTLTVQMDRIVLSRMVSIEQLGYYTLAASAAIGLLQLINPLQQAVLPHAVSLRENGAVLYRLYWKLFGIIAAISLAATLGYLFLGEWLLGIWLHDLSVVKEVRSLLSILLIGTMLNAFYAIGYINWIVHGQVRHILFVNGLSCAIAAVLIPQLVSWKGTMGATFGWLSINLVGFALSLGWARRK